MTERLLPRSNERIRSLGAGIVALCLAAITAMAAITAVSSPQTAEADEGDATFQPLSAKQTAALDDTFRNSGSLDDQTVQAALIAPAKAADTAPSATPAPAAVAPKAIVIAEAYYDQAFRVLQRVNQERANASLPPLRMNAELLSSAMYRATEIAIVFSHTRPNGTAFFTANPAIVAENIAAGAHNADEVMDIWMNSQGHRDNIMNGSYTTIGIGCIVHNDIAYWVQDFGTGGDQADCAQPENDYGFIETELTQGGIYDSNTGETLHLHPQVYPEGPLELAQEQVETPYALSINPGFSYGTTIFPVLVWLSDDRRIASVQEDNFSIVGVNPGTTQLTGMLSYFTYKMDVTVKPGVAVYRLFNPYTNEHLFTLNSDEVNTLSSGGWNYEGVNWRAPKSSVTPVGRLYNPFTSDHHYTADSGEYDFLVASGWIGEDVQFYSNDSSGVPIYRLYNPYNAGPGQHHYTTDNNERNYLASVGWKDEGACFYGIW